TLPARQASLRPRPAAPRFHPATPASPLLLLPRCRLRPDVPPLADLVPLHLPGLHQRPRLARPAIAQRGRRLCAARQRLHPARRPPPGPTPGGPLRAAPLGPAPEPLGPPRQPAAETTLAAGPELLLGPRPGRVPHRPAVCQPPGAGGPLSAAAGPCC